MNEQAGEPGAVAPAATPSRDGTWPRDVAAVETSESRLIGDLERLLRYVSTAKQVEVPKDDLTAASVALQTAKAQMHESGCLTDGAELELFKAIDVLSPRVYPATTGSLEIAEIMEVGRTGGTARQREIRDRVNKLVTRWIRTTIVALLAVFAMTALSFDLHVTAEPAQEVPTAFHIQITTLGSISGFLDPIILGFLGACAYILRSILQSLANQTFVLRDGTTYTLRSILGMILGFMIPKLLSNSETPTQTLGFLGDIAVPFLAGYAVEPMFAALDTIVLTLRDAVSRNPAPGGGKGK